MLEFQKGDLGFDNAHYPDGTPFKNTRDLADFCLSSADDNGTHTFEEHVTVLCSIFPASQEKVRKVAIAYQTQLNPELLKEGKANVRKGVMAWLYFAPIESLEEKMSLMFRLSDANNDGQVSKEELNEGLHIWLMTAKSFYPQIKAQVSEGEAQTFLALVSHVYSQDHIDFMVDQVFDTIGMRKVVRLARTSGWHGSRLQTSRKPLDALRPFY